MNNDARGRGHNRPPEFERVETLVANANRWLFERATITNADMAGVCADFVEQLRREDERLDKALKAERKPHDDAILSIRGRYRDPVDLVGLALRKMLGLQGPWLARERDRADAEKRQREQLALEQAAEAARAEVAAREVAAQGGDVIGAELAAERAREAADKAAKAAAKPAERARAKGDFGSRAIHQRTYWSAKIIDPVKAIAHYADTPEMAGAQYDCALKLGNEAARRDKDEAKAPPGFEFIKREAAQ